MIHEGHPVRAIRTQLLLGLMGGVVVALTGAGVWTYTQVRHEVIEITDFQLRQIAEALPPGMPTQTVAEAGGPEELIVVQFFDDAGQLSYVSHPELALPLYPGTGLLTASAHGQQWRVFRMHRPGQLIQVAQTLASRDAMVLEVAVRTLLPFALLVPLLCMLVWFVVWRSLRSVRELTGLLGSRSAHSLDALEPAVVAPELRPIVEALNRLLAQLRIALGAQQAFIGNAAHELRSPLMALKLQLQLLERAHSPERRAAALGRLHQGLDRSTHLVRQLLNLARYDRPIRKEDLEVVELRELAQGVVAELAGMAEHHRVDLGVIDDDGRAVRALSERDSLRILLMNLIDNAVRYSPVDERVDVLVSVDESGCPTLRVLDNGPGIAPVDRDRVFDRFYRGEGNRSTGSGLGLAIVQSIAERIGASVALADNPLGNGLLVTVRLPAGSLVASDAPGVDTDAPRHPLSGGGSDSSAASR